MSTQEILDRARAQRYRLVMRVLAGRRNVPMFDHPAPIGPELPLSDVLLFEARGWLIDCGRDPWVTERLHDWRVEQLIHRNYCGGIPEFIRNTHGG